MDDGFSRPTTGRRIGFPWELSLRHLGEGAIPYIRQEIRGLESTNIVNKEVITFWWLPIHLSCKPLFPEWYVRVRRNPFANQIRHWHDGGRIESPQKNLPAKRRPSKIFRGLDEHYMQAPCGGQARGGENRRFAAQNREFRISGMDPSVFCPSRFLSFL